eukprot:jgi/Bigna1/81097/fgenesh1_pg.77_\
MPGCHVAQCSSSLPPPSWIIGIDEFSREELYLSTQYGLGANDEVPDISIDPEEGILSIINDSAIHRAYYISLRGDNFRAFDAHDRLLEGGVHRDEKESVVRCLTFIVTVPVMATVDLCRLELPKGGPGDIDL